MGCMQQREHLLAAISSPCWAAPLSSVIPQEMNQLLSVLLSASICRLSFDSLARPLLALPWEVPVADASLVTRLMVRQLGKGEYLQGEAWGAPGGVKENATAAASSLAM